jgi:AbrB family looped-hinge helix DNA binding protein
MTLELVASCTQPVANITITRRQNALSLFQGYAEKALAAGAPPKGLEQAFAATLEISPSMWSQIKASRPIGDKLARQIEQHHGRPTGWLDAQRAEVGLTKAEKAFLDIALAAWRSTNATGRRALLGHLKGLVPPEIRDRLGLKSGDKMAFTMLSDGTVVMRPKTRRLADLAGSLTRPGQPKVAIEDMTPFKTAAAKKAMKRPTR